MDEEYTSKMEEGKTWGKEEEQTWGWRKNKLLSTSLTLPLLSLLVLHPTDDIVGKYIHYSPLSMYL